MQETRDRTGFGIVYDDRWWVGASAGTAHNASYGCQIWINLETVWAVDGDREMRPQPADIDTIISEPRLLIVRMQLPIFDCVICSAYGPHSGRCAEEVQKYWQDTAKVVAKAKKKGGHVIFLCDGNVHLHSDDGDAVQHASFFRNAMEDLGLVPNIEADPVPTFCYADGDGVQDDYICTSSGVVRSSLPSRTVDMSHLVERGNHELLAMEVCIHPASNLVPISRRKLGYDRRKLKDPTSLSRSRCDLGEFLCQGGTLSRLRGHI